MQRGYKDERFCDRPEEVGGILPSCQLTCVLQGEAEGTQGRWWVGLWMVCWVKYSRSVKVKLFQGLAYLPGCHSGLPPLAVWGHGRFSLIPLLLWKGEQRECAGQRAGYGTGERLLPVLLLAEPPLANPSSMWLQLTAIKMC